MRKFAIRTTNGKNTSVYAGTLRIMCATFNGVLREARIDTEYASANELLTALKATNAILSRKVKYELLTIQEAQEFWTGNCKNSGATA